MSPADLNLDPLRKALPKEQATRLLEETIRHNLSNRAQTGALVDIRGETGKELIFVGDLHGRIENLLKILQAGGNLEALKEGKSVLILLGDAVHNEPRKIPLDEEEMAWIQNMGSSVRIIQLIQELKCSYPDNVFYLLGNHDHLSIKYTKFSVRQGWEFRTHLKNTYGEEFVEIYREFIATSPLLFLADGVVANHAGPLKKSFVLEDVRQPRLPANEDHPIVEQLEWRRWKHRSRETAYDENDVKHFLRKIIVQPEALYLVGHSPHLLRDPRYRLNAFTARVMKNHYMIFGANDQTGYARYVSASPPDSISFVPIP